MFVSANRFAHPERLGDECPHPGHAGHDGPGLADGQHKEHAGATDSIDFGPPSARADVSSTRPTPKREDVINRALTQLAELAADPRRFAEVLSKAFGPDYDRAAAERLRQQLLAGDTSWMPDVEFASSEQLHGAGGAYATENHTVYLNSDIRSPKRSAEVLLEELGHHIDTLLNRRDAAGDEGEIFRRLVAGEPLSDVTLAGLRSEDDHGTADVDGHTRQVENFSFFNPLSWFGGGGSSVPPVVRDVAVDAGQRVLDYVGTLPLHIRAAAKEWVDALWANAKAFGADLVKRMETVAVGFGKLARGDVEGAKADFIKGIGGAALDTFHAFARLTMDTISAVQVAAGLEPEGRKLRDYEIAELGKVFGNTVDFSKVKIKEGSAGIFAGDRAITMGNTIYLKNDTSLSTLIHEMTHVWQFQVGGNDYMLKAGAAQFTNWLAGNETNVAYDWTRDIDRGWAALNPEQQAQLIQDAGTGSPSYVQKMGDWTTRSIALRAKEIGFQLTGLFGADPIARAAQKRALEAERAQLQLDRPKFAMNGRNYTAQVDDALANLRNRLGAP
jgi:hypothetical protein